MLFKNVTREQIIALLNKYDDNKGYGRRIFGDTKGIKELRAFVEKQLAGNALSDNLSEVQLSQLTEILKTRFLRIEKTSRNYRNLTSKLTNKIYDEITGLISENPNVLSLVQKYKNDYTVTGKYLNEVSEKIFVTSSGYAFPISEIENHIRHSESLSHPILADPSIPIIALSEEDITALENYPSIKKLIDRVKEKFAQYQNSETLTGDPLWAYPKTRLFITQSGHCLLIEEYVEILKKSNTFKNPYTNMELSDNEISELMEKPEISKADKLLRVQQQYCASKISRLTINKLATLARSLLNKNDLFVEFEAVPTAQKGYEEFDEYYKNMPAIERECLNNYWIGSWTGTLVGPGIILGMGSIKFGELYRSADKSCIHTVAGSIIKLIKQLDPTTKFHFDNIIASILSASVGRSNFFESKDYLVSNKKVCQSNNKDLETNIDEETPLLKNKL